MKILALEFSSPQRSVAIVQASRDARTNPVSVSEVLETGGPSSHALGLVEEALAQARLDRAQIEGLAVGIGPGSYTGIRSAIAFAQGWQLARDVPLLGISTADCLAAQARAEGVIGRVNIVIDAQRGEFYLAAYSLGPEGWQEIEPLHLATMAEVQVRARSGDPILGPEVTKWFPGSRLLFPRAATLGQLAVGRTDFIPGEKMEPIYLRQTQFVKAPSPRIPGP